MAEIKTLRVDTETHKKLKNFSTTNTISILEATEKIVSFVVSNGYTVADLKQLNSESTYDRIFNRIEYNISVLKGIEKDNLKPLVREVRDLDQKVSLILSNMQMVQDQEVSIPQVENQPPDTDFYAYENFSKDREGKWFINRAEKGTKICDKAEQLLQKLESRLEVACTEKRYILNDEILKDIEHLKDLIKSF